MMKEKELLIGVNLSHIHHRLAGVRTYAANFIFNFARSWPEANFLIFVGLDGERALTDIRAEIADLENIKFQYMGNDPSKKISMFLTETIHIPRKARELGISAIISLDYHCPIFFHNTNILIHDMNYKDIPNLLPFWYVINRRIMVSIFSRASRQVWTISDLMSERFEKYYPKKKDKIKMIGSGVDRENAIPEEPLPNPPQKPYLLSIGTFNLHKRYVHLLKAFEQINWDGYLVLAGRPGPALNDPEFVKVVERLGDRVILYPEGLQDGQIAWLYNNAHAYVTASVYEGYGLTILEAMRAGIPVAAARAAALPYVGGDAAIYFDPDDQQETCRTLERLVSEPDLRSQLIAKGHERLKECSWDAVAGRARQAVTELMQAVSS